MINNFKILHKIIKKLKETESNTIKFVLIIQSTLFNLKFISFKTIIYYNTKYNIKSIFKERNKVYLL